MILIFCFSNDEWRARLFCLAVIETMFIKVQNKIKKSRMSDINSSLIGFLKKKSLFTNSPEKSLKNRQRSKEKRELQNSARTPRNVPARNLANVNTESARNLKKNASERHIDRDFHSDLGNDSLSIQSPARYQQPPNIFKSDNKPAKRNFAFKNPEDSSKKAKEEEKVSTLWTGLVNYSTTFESARLESVQCLDNLSVKIQTEVSNINYKIDIFHSKMTKILNNQFANLQEKIYAIVDQVFAESEKNIKSYIKHQEEILAAELLAMRHQLLTQYEKIETMREEINKPNWRKVAGELLSSELETRVEDMLVKSRSIDIEHWQVGDLGANKVVHLEDQLRDMVRLHVR